MNLDIYIHHKQFSITDRDMRFGPSQYQKRGKKLTRILNKILPTKLGIILSSLLNNILPKKPGQILSRFLNQILPNETWPNVVYSQRNLGQEKSPESYKLYLSKILIQILGQYLDKILEEKLIRTLISSNLWHTMYHCSALWHNLSSWLVSNISPSNWFGHNFAPLK